MTTQMFKYKVLFAIAQNILMGLHFERKLTGAICIKGIKDNTKSDKKQTLGKVCRQHDLKPLQILCLYFKKTLKNIKK